MKLPIKHRTFVRSETVLPEWLTGIESYLRLPNSGGIGITTQCKGGTRLRTMRSNGSWQETAMLSVATRTDIGIIFVMCTNVVLQSPVVPEMFIKFTVSSHAWNHYWLRWWDIHSPNVGYSDIQHEYNCHHSTITERRSAHRFPRINSPYCQRHSYSLFVSCFSMQSSNTHALSSFELRAQMSHNFIQPHQLSSQHIDGCITLPAARRSAALFWKRSAQWQRVISQVCR